MQNVLELIEEWTPPLALALGVIIAGVQGHWDVTIFLVCAVAVLGIVEGILNSREQAGMDPDEVA
jgi:hypothetical protein